MVRDAVADKRRTSPCIAGCFLRSNKRLQNTPNHDLMPVEVVRLERGLKQRVLGHVRVSPGDEEVEQLRTLLSKRPLSCPFGPGIPKDAAMPSLLDVRDGLSLPAITKTSVEIS